MSTLNAPDFDLIPITEQDTEDFERNALDNVITALGANSVTDILLKVYKLNPVSNKEEWCFDCDPEALPLENRLLSAYGGGEFAVRVMTPTPEGRKSLKRKIKISIAQVLEPDKIIPEKNDNMDNVISAMMEAMQKNTSNMLQAFQTSQLNSQIEMQKMIIEMQNKSDKPPTIMEIMTFLKTMDGDKKDPMDVFSEMINMNKIIKDEMSPEPAPAEGSMGQLLQLGSRLVEAAKSAPQKETPAPGQKVITNKTENPGDNINEKPSEHNMNLIIKHKLKNHLQMLCAKAADDRSPSLWCDLTIDEIPDQYYPQLVDVLGDNDDFAFNSMMEINPAINEYKAWFMEFISEMRLSFEPEKEPENDEKPGDLTNKGVSGDDNGNNRGDIPNYASKNQTVIDNTYKNDA